MKYVWRVLTIAILTPCTSALAVPLDDSLDSTWEAIGLSINLEVIRVSGGINAGGFLEFGIYDATDPSSRTPIFGDGGISAGDTNTIGVSGHFGFYLSNTGGGFGGPFDLFSDSSLNPAIPPFTTVAGLDAMAAEDMGGDTYLIEFEDLFLPLNPGRGDILVRVSQIMPTNAPEPATLALLGLGLLGIGVRRKRA